MNGIIAVLSGMSNIAQMEDNLSYMRNFKPLSDEERKVIAAAQEELKKDNSIKCTGRHYCTNQWGVNITPDFCHGIQT